MCYLSAQRRHMLPRPLSILSTDRARGLIELLFAVKGEGTALLAGALPGSAQPLLGPLGRGFPSPPPGALLVAGGMGIVPLAFLVSATTMPLTLIYGTAGAKAQACAPAELQRSGLNLLEATEDGSRGVRGTALDLFRERLITREASSEQRPVVEAPAEKVSTEQLSSVVSPAAQIPTGETPIGEASPEEAPTGEASTGEASIPEAVYACGPRGLLGAVARICLEQGIKAWFSLEERMACGVGACRGCAVPGKGGYHRVCADGPVFSVEEVLWL